MQPLKIDSVNKYVNDNIAKFHEARLKSVKGLTLNKLLRKNPYLFKAKNVEVASELVPGLLEAFLSSSEEKSFGDFLEGLALFVAQQTAGGHKSTASGVDLEFFKDGCHYVVSIKSGPSWGNSSQQDKLEQDLRNAIRRVRQSKQAANVRSVLGICYGKTKTNDTPRGYLKVVGQNFWYLISDNKNLYTDVIEPIGYRAKEHNKRFHREKANLTNRLIRQFTEEFCEESGAINWKKLVQHNSGNLDLDNFL